MEQPVWLGELNISVSYVSFWDILLGSYIKSALLCTTLWYSHCLVFVLQCNEVYINPLNAELNPICYLLTLLGAHHFLHVSRIRVKLLTFRLLMSYIYIYIYIWSTHS